MFSKPMPPDEIQRWLEQVVLPRKAPWIASVSQVLAGVEDVADVSRRP